MSDLRQSVLHLVWRAVPTLLLAAFLQWIAETYIVTNIALPDRLDNDQQQQQQHRLEDAETRRLTLPDFNWTFQLSPADIWQQFALMGITGRKWYLIFNLLDLLIYQWLANECLVSALRLVFDGYWIPAISATAFKWNRFVRACFDWALWLAKCEWIADGVENVSILLTLLFYPERIRWALVLLSIASPLKWVLVVGCLTFALVGAVMGKREWMVKNRRLRQMKRSG